VPYVDYEYYVSGYLLGREPAVPEKVFSYWEKQARSEIDKRTFGRIKADETLVSDQVKDCCCEIAELLYQADSVVQQSLQEGAPGPLSQSTYTESGKSGKVREIIYRYLGNTGLLYAGI